MKISTASSMAESRLIQILQAELLSLNLLLQSQNQKLRLQSEAIPSMILSVLLNSLQRQNLLRFLLTLPTVHRLYLQGKSFLQKGKLSALLQTMTAIPSRLRDSLPEPMQMIAMLFHRSIETDSRTWEVPSTSLWTDLDGICFGRFNRKPSSGFL